MLLPGQDLVKGQAKSGWTMYTVLGVSSPWPRATSMVGESITVLTERMPGLSVQVYIGGFSVWTVTAFVLSSFLPHLSPVFLFFF